MRNRFFVFHESEMDRLAGERSTVLRTYFWGIKPRADFETGMVGDRPGRRVSIQSIREAIEVIARPGVKERKYSRSEVQGAIDRLVGIGMVERLSKKGDRHLVLRCKLVTEEKFQQNKVGRNYCDEVGRQDASKNTDFKGGNDFFKERSNDALNSRSPTTSDINKKKVCSYGNDAMQEIFDSVNRAVEPASVFSRDDILLIIRDYLKYCESREADWSFMGFKNHLQFKYDVMVRRMRSKQTADDLNQASIERMRADGRRVEMQADQIDSRNIFQSSGSKVPTKPSEELIKKYEEKYGVSSTCSDDAVPQRDQKVIDEDELS